MDIIKVLQEKLNHKGIKAYIVPTSDFHNSEYVSDYFKCRAFLTGFTGSAGTLVVTQEKAYLWTDGRYHIQAAKQIEGKSITLMKQGLPGVQTMEQLLGSYLNENDVLAFDGRVMSTSSVLALCSKLPNIKLQADEDLIDEI